MSKRKRKPEPRDAEGRSLRKPNPNPTKNKDRGTLGERKVRDYIRAEGILCDRTGLMTVKPGERRPDLRLSTIRMHVGVPIMAEVKTRKGLKWLFDAFQQADFVFLNTDAKPPVACMSMEQFGILYRSYFFGNENKDE